MFGGAGSGSGAKEGLWGRLRTLFRLGLAGQVSL